MNIACVLVTFNRLNDLKKALQCYHEQVYLPKVIIVVNNCSSDGTQQYLDEWKKIDSPYEKKVIHLSENTGGSGGFHEGLKNALDTNCDWYWIADDDAFVDKYAFEWLNIWKKEHPGLVQETSALCGAVLDTPQNMNIAIGHRRRIYLRCGVPKQVMISEREYEKEFFEIGLFTYVGSAIKASAIREIGLPCKDLFIYYDDLEHSYRVSKTGHMYCIPKCKVFHNAAVHEESYGSNWRSYYQSRNSMWFLKKHFPIAYLKFKLKRFLQRLILKPFCKYTEVNQMDWDALLDAENGKLGVSEKYYIGWKKEG